jgi:formylglycine-generating enzyme required for sulfatase activity
VTDHEPIFLSYSRNDPEAAANLRTQLEKGGLSVFKDDESIREGELWLSRLQAAVDGCSGFVLLVGRDGVSRWIGAETQVALIRYFGPHEDAKRLPIFPVLLGATAPDSLPPFLRLFQTTSWNGSDPLPEGLLEQIRERRLVAAEGVVFEGCPFVGLDAFQIDQARLFFGRQKETLEALACFDTRPASPRVRWLEVNGNSGSGKSSLMNAGLLPLVDQGWLWPRTRIAHWLRIGPLMPGQHPVGMLIESLVRFSREVLKEPAEMAGVRPLLEADDRGLADWLRSRKREDTAFLLAIDQLEELFTFADPDERKRFDRLLATALADPDCPLFLISTVRADFLDRFEDLPRLVNLRNRLARPWTLPPIGEDGLREVIAGPARLAGLDVSEVQEAMVAEARDEPGALPLVENALSWLWEAREDRRLSARKLNAQGGLAGILSRSADDLLAGLGKDRDPALELLFRLVRVDPEGRHHSRQRIPLEEAIAVAGGGAQGHALVTRLCGERPRDGDTAAGPLRLITVTEEPALADGSQPTGRWVSLIHETLIRSKGLDDQGRPQPYWPMLWDYIEAYQDRAARREQLRVDTSTWLEHDRAASYLWSHERVRELVATLRKPGPRLLLSAEETEFLGPIDAETMLAELQEPDTDHKRRALIGERLAVLGDPRPGVGVGPDGLPVIDWCPVPGGEAAIQVQRRFLWGTRAMVRPVADFHISRYPVTVAQYRAFLEAEDGWRDARWWAEDLYRDPEGDSYDVGRFGSHPAVYVSWFDTVAFCRWLSHRSGLAVRLPDEWEWQHAATLGDPERIFPWGPDWDPKEEPFRANTFESRLGAATAVGLYPGGASPAGVLDMTGTVWEWCLNKYKRPNVTVSREDDFAERVVRGGSWAGSQGFARSAFRSGFVPDGRGGDIGFRVLCSSHIFLVLPGRGALRCRASGRGPTRIPGASGIVRRPRFAGRGEEGKMARVGPVRTARLLRTVGRIPNRGAGRTRSPGAPAITCEVCCAQSIRRARYAERHNPQLIPTRIRDRQNPSAHTPNPRHTCLHERNGERASTAIR